MKGMRKNSLYASKGFVVSSSTSIIEY